MFAGGTFIPATSTVIFYGTSAVTSAGQVFNLINVGTSGAGGKMSLTDDLTVGRLVFLYGGTTTLDITGRTLTVSGNVDMSPLDNFVATGSTFAFNGATTLLSAGLTFNNLQVGTASSGASASAFTVGKAATKRS